MFIEFEKFAVSRPWDDSRPSNQSTKLSKPGFEFQRTIDRARANWQIGTRGMGKVSA